MAMKTDERKNTLLRYGRAAAVGFLMAVVVPGQPRSLIATALMLVVLWFTDAIRGW